MGKKKNFKFIGKGIRIIIPVLFILPVFFLNLSTYNEQENIYSTDEQLHGSLSTLPGNKKQRADRKPGPIRNEEYMTRFYLPKSMEEVSADRDEYLKTYGSFSNLGEPLQKDYIGSWSSVGPFGIYDITHNLHNNGRIIAFDMYGDSPNILFCGGASGGLWKSTDGSNSWFNIMDTLGCPSVSSIACSQLASDNTVWVSTGARYNGAGIQIGRLYKSTNGGTSWSNINLPAASGNITKLEINAFDKNRVFIACEGGLFKTTNGGSSFTHVYPAGNVIADVITFTNVITSDTSIVLMAVESNGIFRSTNGGNNFSLLTLPGYNTAVDSRITLATNPAAPNKTFALVGRSNGQFLGIWFTADKGATWIQKTLPVADGAQQLWNQGLGVSTTRVFVGWNAGVTFYSTDDGSTWGLSSYTHPDVHKIHPYSNTVIYEVNDGGVYRSTNSGVNWTTPGAQFLPLTQSYTLYASTSLPNSVWSGTQDNGTIGGYDNIFQWEALTCCDGLEYFQYSGYHFNSLAGLSEASGNRYQAKLLTAPLADPWIAFSQGLPNGTPWNAGGANEFFIKDNYFYTSLLDYVYRRTTTNMFSATWVQLGARPHPSSNQVVSKMGVSSGYVLAGFEFYTSPIVRRYNPANSSWETPDLTGVPTSNIVVTDFENGSNANNIFMSISGTSGARIFKSINNGASWANITGNLPNLVNIRCILTNKTNDQIIYIGSDFGVFVTGNGGVTWYNYSTGMPSVCYVNSLKLENNNTNLYAATFGRGVFKSGILTGIENLSNNNPAGFQLAQNFPNPFNPSTSIKFSLPSDENVTLEVFDINGRLVEQPVRGDMLKAGEHEIKFDGSNLSSGTYFYRLTTPRFTDVKKMILVK